MIVSDVTAKVEDVIARRTEWKNVLSNVLICAHRELVVSDIAAKVEDIIAARGRVKKFLFKYHLHT